jgi:hypothetical protein
VPEHPKPRAQSKGIPAPIGDEESIPVLMPPGAPRPDRGSRVRPYYTPEDYAIADQRRTERIVDRAVEPIKEGLKQLGAAFDKYTDWDREIENERHKVAMAEVRERERLTAAVSAIQTTEAAKVEKRKRWSRLVDGALGAMLATGITILASYLT